MVAGQSTVSSGSSPSASNAVVVMTLKVDPGGYWPASAPHLQRRSQATRSHLPVRVQPAVGAGDLLLGARSAGAEQRAGEVPGWREQQRPLAELDPLDRGQPLFERVELLLAQGGGGHE